jgi:ribosome-binding factor A
MSRLERISEAVKKEVSLILQEELKDPRLGFVTITNAEVTADLKYAKVFFSVLGGDEEYKKTQLALDSASGFVRKLVGERVKLRITPEIIFKEDRSIEYSVKIEEILNEIKELDKNRPVPKRATGAKKKKGERSEPKKSTKKRKKKS